MTLSSFCLEIVYNAMSLMFMIINVQLFREGIKNGRRLDESLYSMTIYYLDPSSHDAKEKTTSIRLVSVNQYFVINVITLERI